MGDEALLRVEGIDTFYGSVQILHGLDLEVRRGEIVAIIGPNGAGKSTALKAIFGLVRPRRGRIRFDGQDITGLAPDRIVRRGLSYVPQGRAVFPSLSVEENLDMGAFIERDRAAVRRRREAVYERFPALRQRLGQAAASLSGGEQQILAMGRALMLEPELLLLDEPSIGLAPQVVEQVIDKIVQINRGGITVAMVEQNASMALEVCDRAYVMVMGRNRLTGPGRQLLDDPKVQEIYLGRV